MIARTDLFGAIATTVEQLANRARGGKPGSPLRKFTSKVTGVSSVRLLAPYTKQRFSIWFKHRPRVSLDRSQGEVTVFPTCLVEYHETAIGKDLIKVYERNGIECNTTDAGCCGAPWLHAGDIKRFTKVAKKNVKKLAAEIRSGTVVVVPQPTCSYVLKKDYVDYVGGADAELVAANTYDTSEYLMRIHHADHTVLDTNFDGDIVEKITYHAPCHLRAQTIGFKSRDLMTLTGADVEVVQQCSGIEGMWGLRAGNDDISIPMAERLGELIAEVDGDVVAGDCHLGNTAIVEQTGRHAQHPLQIVARAYGIAQEN